MTSSTPTALALLLGSSLLVAPTTSAQGAGFAAQTVLTTDADSPVDLAAADVDGDGDLDVLVLAQFDDELVWIENLGGGAFGPRQVLAATSSTPLELHAVDLDGDGDHDALVRSSATVEWFENLGGGSFGAVAPIAAGTSVGAAFPADLDGDGDLDVLRGTNATQGTTNDLVWFENLGGGAFGPAGAIDADVQAVQRIFVDDLDGDGDAEVLVATSQGGTLAVYENLGGGSFGPEQVLADAGFLYRDVSAVDLDGNGTRDVLTAFVSGAGDEVAWLPNQGGGTFGAPQSLPLVARSLASADLDADGDLDVVALNSSSFHPFALCENLGGGAFGPFQPIVVGNNPDIGGGRAVRAADLDGDGHLDLVTASSSDDKVLFWRNFPEVSTFGEGCGAFSTPMYFSPSSEAITGAPITGYVTHAPSALTVVGIGFSDSQWMGLPLPLDLGLVGMNGCTLYTSLVEFGLPTVPGPIPFIRTDFTGPVVPPGFVGVEFFAQAFGVTPGANYASNAIRWTITQ